MSELINYIKNQSKEKTLPLLPLFHSCECFDARTILSSKQLEIRHCKYFNEDLLYFYYGKPAYKVAEKVLESRTDIEYLPVCFIVDPNKIPIYRVYPFDSGAFHEDLYASYLHRNMRIQDFELENNIDGIKSYISVVFLDNQKYIDGEAFIKEQSNNPFVDALLGLMTSYGAMKFDERGRTVEVITNQSLQIADVVKCVILPENMLRDIRVFQFLKDNSIDYRTYHARRLVHPSNYSEVVVQIALNYINSYIGGE